MWSKTGFGFLTFPGSKADLCQLCLAIIDRSIFFECDQISLPAASGH